MNKKSIINFGEEIKGKKFKVLNERSIRASAGIMLLLGLIAFINGFILQKFIVIPYIAGFLLLNFLIGVFLNPKFSPTMLLGDWIVSKQKPIYVGAIQKKFAWSLGIGLSAIITGLSSQLVSNPNLFPPVCLLCLTCLILLYFESVFGICIGCKLYYLAIRLKLMKEPKEKPNCMGDSCEVN